MEPSSDKSLSFFIEQQILNEEKKYHSAFEKGAEFQVLKDIRTKIKMLKAELSVDKLPIETGL